MGRAEERRSQGANQRADWWSACAANGVAAQKTPRCESALAARIAGKKHAAEHTTHQSSARRAAESRSSFVLNVSLSPATRRLKDAPRQQQDLSACVASRVCKASAAALWAQLRQGSRGRCISAEALFGGYSVRTRIPQLVSFTQLLRQRARSPKHPAARGRKDLTAVPLLPAKEHGRR